MPSKRARLRRPGAPPATRRNDETATPASSELATRLHSTAIHLLRLENAVCTPHIGYVEQDSYELYFRAAFENVVNFIAGAPTNIVNPDALRVIR